MFHGEFQLKDEKEFDLRMLEYRAYLMRVFKRVVDQHAFFIGKRNPRHIKAQIKQPNLTFGYTLHVLAEINYRVFLYSDIPEAIILAILAEHRGLSAEKLIDMILEKLFEKKGDSLETRRLIRHLHVMSYLRNLQIVTFKKCEHMLTKGIKEFKDDPFYLAGLEEGLEEGLEKGLEEGRVRQAIWTICELLKQGLDRKVIAHASFTDESFVDRIEQQLLRRAEIEAALRKGDAPEAISEKLDVHPAVVSYVQMSMQTNGGVQ